MQHPTLEILRRSYLLKAPGCCAQHAGGTQQQKQITAAVCVEEEQVGEAEGGRGTLSLRPACTYWVSAPSSMSTFSLAWLLRTVRVKRCVAELCLE